MASAPMDLLIEIGPPADLSLEMLRNLSQPTVVGTLNENVTPSSVTACLATGESSVGPTPAGVSGGLGRGVTACRAAGGAASFSL
jgi:hypothetical protein